MFERVGVFCEGGRNLHQKSKTKGPAKLIEYLIGGELPLMGRGSRITAQTAARAEGELPLRYTFGAYSNRNPHIAS